MLKFHIPIKFIMTLKVMPYFIYTPLANPKVPLTQKL